VPLPLGAKINSAMKTARIEFRPTGIDSADYKLRSKMHWRHASGTRHLIHRLRALVVISLVTLAVISDASRSVAQEANPAKPPASRLTQENYDRIKDRKDKITEKEVLAIFGQPTSVYATNPQNGDYAMSWKHRTYIRVKTRRERVISVVAAFSPYVKSDTVTLQTFKKIKLGMTEDQVREMLGTPDGAGSVKDAEQYVWEEYIGIDVTFRNEIAIGLAMARPIGQ